MELKATSAFYAYEEYTRTGDYEKSQVYLKSITGNTPNIF